MHACMNSVVSGATKKEVHSASASTASTPPAAKLVAPPRKTSAASATKKKQAAAAAAPSPAASDASGAPAEKSKSKPTIAVMSARPLEDGQLFGKGALPPTPELSSEERLAILRQVSDGAISQEEAVRLMQAMCLDAAKRDADDAAVVAAAEADQSKSSKW